MIQKRRKNFIVLFCFIEKIENKNIKYKRLIHSITMYTVLGTKNFIHSGFFIPCTKGKQKHYSNYVTIYFEGRLLKKNNDYNLDMNIVAFLEVFLRVILNKLLQFDIDDTA